MKFKLKRFTLTKGNLTLYLVCTSVLWTIYLQLKSGEAVKPQSLVGILVTLLFWPGLLAAVAAQFADKQKVAATFNVVLVACCALQVYQGAVQWGERAGQSKGARATPMFALYRPRAFTPPVYAQDEEPAERAVEAGLVDTEVIKQASSIFKACESDHRSSYQALMQLAREAEDPNIFAFDQYRDPSSYTFVKSTMNAYLSAIELNQNIFQARAIDLTSRFATLAHEPSICAEAIRMVGKQQEEHAETFAGHMNARSKYGEAMLMLLEFLEADPSAWQIVDGEVRFNLPVEGKAYQRYLEHARRSHEALESYPATDADPDGFVHLLPPEGLAELQNDWSTGLMATSGD